MTDPTTPDNAGDPAARPPVPDADYPGQAGYPGQPAQPGQPVPPPPYGAAPSVPDSRPKTLAIVALILGVVGLLLSLGGFLPIPFVSLGAAIVGGILLLAALIVGIVALVSKKQGGTGLGIAAIVVSVVGGILWVFAIAASLLWVGLAAVGNSSSDGNSSSAAPQVSSSAVAGPYDEAAFVAEVRPQILEIMQSIDPAITDEQVLAGYSDETLVSIGKSLVALDDTNRTAARESFVSSAVETSGGMFTDETAGRFFDVIIDAAEAHLVE